jgi:2-succinyl-5-enolpyruvyl-6-hydroxy-3-cyclohexene-1-carboxylate synthase
MFLSWDPKLLADSINETKADPNWLSSWNEAESRVEERLDDAFAQLAEPFEGKVPRILSESLPDACDLFIANSMPIRDVEWFWKPSSGKRRLHSNRGANGIDGTLSTAIGIAHASDSPSYLLTGDLAFLHDSNGLLATHQFSGSLTIIVINNHGGGIFENLPVSQLASFEKYFATPQKAEIAGIAKVHGISYEKVCELEDLRTIVENTSQQGIRILEVETNRKTDVTARKLLLDIGPSN